MNAWWKDIAYARSFLFVPGNRPDRFVKARDSGADCVVLDIEDAVPPDLKETARSNILSWFRSGGNGVVRINDATSASHHADVMALSGIPCAVMLAKTRSSEDIAHLSGKLGPESCVLPLLETAGGIQQSREICASRGVLRAVFGNADLALDLGVDQSDLSALAYARAQVVLASAAVNLPGPIDGVTLSLVDDEGLRRDAANAASMGFSGKLCIHPRQVSAVNSAFTPTDDEISWALRVLKACGDGSVSAIDGQVVGGPVIRRARRLVERHGR